MQNEINEKDKKELVIVLGILGIINLLLVLEETSWAWNCFVINDIDLIFSKFILSVCLYGDSKYVFKREMWMLIFSFISSIIALVLVSRLKSNTSLNDVFDYIYAKVNTYVAGISLVVSSLFIVFLIYFLKLYNHNFLSRWELF